MLRNVEGAGSALEFHFYNYTKEMKKDRLQLIFSPAHKTITLFMNQALHSPKWDLFLTFKFHWSNFESMPHDHRPIVFFLPPLISFRNLFLLLLHGPKMNYLMEY